MTNVDVTNGTITNSTSTNFFSNFANILSAYIGTLFGNNSNFITSNASTSNATTTNATNANLTNTIGTNATFTNATATNLVAQNASFTQATATIFHSQVSNIVNLNSTNGTITNSSSTNIFSSFANILSAYIGTLFGNSSNFITSNASTSNATTTNAVNANFTTTVSTNTNGTNATITNATVTNLSVGNLQAGLQNGFIWRGSSANINEATNTMFISNAGNIGIGNSVPANKLEISQGTIGNSGLRLTNLTSAFSPGTTTTKALVVDANGDVVLANISTSCIPGGSSSANSECAGVAALQSNTSGTNNVAIGDSSLSANTIGSSNTAVGTNALSANTTGSNDTAIGQNSLRSNSTGYDNTAIGSQAMQSNTSGYLNTATGRQALFSNTSGFQNSAYGSSALYNNTTGSLNVAIGETTLFSNTTGSNNVAMGQQTLYFNTTGANDSAVGQQALYSNTSGSQNSAFGTQALFSNTSGSNNGGFGYQSLYNNTTGSQNTGLGMQSLFSNTTGGSNSAVGLQALYSNTGGSQNTSNGVQSMFNNTTGANNVSSGYRSMFNNTTGNQNTANGTQALQANTTGGSNTANGYQAMLSNTSGSGNTANGQLALQGNTTGANNVAVGLNSMFSNTSGGLNTANGYESMYSNTTGVQNVGIGASALRANTSGNYNTAVGESSMFSNTTGLQNVGLGTQALYSNTTGSNNVSTGYQSLFTNTTGSNNNAYGEQALFLNTTGADNNAFGFLALRNNTIGSSNLGIGNQSLNSNTTGNANIAIGLNTLFANTTASNNLAIGNSALLANTTGANNMAYGTNAGLNNTTGSNNSYIGIGTGLGITTGSNNTVLGSNVTGLATNTSNNIIIADGAGNRRINVDSTGNVGIGTNVPNNKLNVVTTLQTNTGATFSATDNHAINLFPSLPAGSFNNMVAAGDQALIFSGGTIDTGGLVIGPWSSSILNPGLKISNTGNVGVGAINPANKFEITASTTNAGGLRLTNLLSSSIVGTSTTKALTVDQYGDVVLANIATSCLPTGGSLGTNECSGTNSLQANTTGTNNAAFGDGTLVANTTGSGNYAGGAFSLFTNTTGDYNTAVGYQSLNQNTSGTNNAAFGLNALLTNSTGGQNTSIGASTLQANTTGSNNTALGFAALYSNTTGTYNVALGNNALNLNTTGGSNIAIGINSQLNTTIGGANVSIGQSTMYANTSGNNNTVVGYGSAQVSTTGSQNTMLGNGTGNNLTTGDTNLFLGYNTGQGITTGRANTILGSNVTGLGGGLANNIIIADGDGNQRINVLSNGNVGIGNTAPNNKLELTSAAAGTSGLRFTNLLSTSATTSSNGKALTTNASGDVVLVDSTNCTNSFCQNGNTFGTNGILGTLDGFAQTFLTNGTEKVRIDTAGNVGIGTTAPGAKLDVRGSIRTIGNSTGVFQMYDTTAAANYGTFYKSDGTTPIAHIGGAAGAAVGGGTVNDFTIRAPNGNLLLYPDSGNVGIGTTAPDYKLDVNGSSNIFGRLVIGADRAASYGDGNLSVLTNATNVGIDLQANASGNSVLRFVNNTYAADIGSISASGTSTKINGIGGANIVSFTSATTSQITTGGYNIISGCYAKNDVCIGIDTGLNDVYNYTQTVLNNSASGAGPYTNTSVGTTPSQYAQPYGLVINGNYLYVANNGEDTVSVYNISSPTTPTLLGSFPTGCSIAGLSTSPDGSALYVTDYVNNNFKVFNLSASATNPPQISSHSSGGTYPIGIKAVGNNRLYIANNGGTNSIAIYDISNPLAPSYITNVTFGTNITGIEAVGSYLYVTSFTANVIYVLDISNPATITNTGTTVGTGSGPTQMSVANGQLYVSNYGANTISQYSVSTPSLPTLVTSFAAGGTSPAGIAFKASGGYFYGANNGSNSITTYKQTSAVATNYTGSASNTNGSTNTTTYELSKPLYIKASVSTPALYSAPGTPSTTIRDALIVNGVVRSRGFVVDIAADLAETFPTSEQNIAAGTLVSFSTKKVYWNTSNGSATTTSSGETYLINEVKTASGTDDVIGVVSTNPGFLLGGTKGIPVAFSGRIPVQVTTESGVVKNGDKLTLSISVPGKAMKLDMEGNSIGVAMSDDTGNGKVLMLVQQGYSKNNIRKDFLAKKKGLLTNSASTTTTVDIGNISIRDLITEIANKLANLANEVVTRVVKTELLCVGKYCVNEEQFAKILNTSGIDLYAASTNQLPVNNASNLLQNPIPEYQVSTTTNATDTITNTSWVSSSTAPVELNVSSTTPEIINTTNSSGTSTAP